MGYGFCVKSKKNFVGNEGHNKLCPYNKANSIFINKATIP